MSFKRHFHFVTAAFLFLSLSSVQAKDVTALQTEVNASGVRAEVCLVFNEPIAGQDRAKLLRKLSLSIGKVRQKIRAQDLSLSPGHLCVQNLRHRQKYQLAYREGGEKYKTSFRVPDRPKKLHFVSSAQKHLPRHYEALKRPDLTGAAHVLRSVNVPKVHLTLYHVFKSEHYASAWQHFERSNLSPSESLLFARDHGEQVFESDLLFSDMPNDEQTLVVPLPVPTSLKPGLYYLAAMPQSKEGAHPALFAGQWFLVSDLYMSVVRVKGGLQVYSYRKAAVSDVKDRFVAVWDDAGNQLAKGRTDKDGKLFLPLDEEVFVVSVQDPQGVDLLSLTSDHTMDISDLAVRAEVQTDKDIYYPGDNLEVSLYAQGQSGAPYQAPKSMIQLIRSDDVVYVEKAVSQAKDGTYHTALTLPPVGKADVWQLVWRAEGGGVLARKEVEIALDLSIHRVELQHKTDQLDAVQVRVLNKAGKGTPYKRGWISVQCERPRFVHLPSYLFGVDPLKVCLNQPRIPFLTDAKGMATLNVYSDVRWSKKLTAHVERSARTAQIILPVSQQSIHIGIRAHAEDGVYPENSMASFDVVSAWGGSRETLYYTIYEEGRRFDWFLQEGKWAYERMSQHRRIGGGHFKLVETAPQKIEWPVTTGAYLLEISNADGVVLAQRHFEAGRLRKGKGAILLPYMFWPKEKAFPIILDEPAMVHVTLTDGNGVYTHQEYLKAGRRALKLPVQQVNGNRVAVRFDVMPDDGAAAYVVEKRLNFEPLPVRALPGGKEVTFDLPTELTVYDGDYLSLPFGLQTKGEGGVYALDVEMPVFVTLRRKLPAKIKLTGGEAKKLIIGMTFEKPIDVVLHFKLSDVKGRHWYYDLPVRVKPKARQNWSVQKTQVKAGGTFSFKKTNADLYVGSRLPIPPVLEELELLMMAMPQSPQEVFVWLHTIDLWRPLLKAMGLLSNDGWWYVKQRALREVLLLQNTDGSFANDDIVQTAAALHALYLYGNGVYSFEEKRAMQWIQDRLKSASLVETERAGHAYAFCVLAQLGRQDVSALRYFAQSNEEALLPVEAQVSLVLAFAQLHDDQEAAKWFEKISIEELKANIEALSLLVGYDPFSYSVGLKKSASPYYLGAVAKLARKEGTWRIAQGGESQKYYGVMPFEAVDSSFKNQGSSSLYVVKAERIGEGRQKAAQQVKRTLYHSNGTPVQEGEVLVGGVSYVMQLSGEAENALRIVVPASSAFSYSSLDVDRSDLARKVLSWLPRGVASPTAVVQSENGFSVNAPAGIAWHATFIMTPNYSGAFSVPALQAVLDGVDVPLKQDGLRVKVF